MPKLEIDWGDLAVAFENASWMMNYYLDSETGQVLLVSDEDQGELERIRERIVGAGSQEAPDFAQAIEELGVPDWQQEGLLLADKVERDATGRYIEIQKADSGDGYRDMQEFISTVQDQGLQDRLWRAIQGRGAFRRFKDVLLEHPGERERWFDFGDERVDKRMLYWLEEMGIELA